eukprot:358155-Prymnesium_polylepis.1
MRRGLLTLLVGFFFSSLRFGNSIRTWASTALSMPRACCTDSSFSTAASPRASAARCARSCLIVLRSARHSASSAAHNGSGRLPSRDM